MLGSLDGDESVYGVIVIDGKGTLFANIGGGATDILHKMTVDLPNKHNKGGQSAPRFGRLRQERRHNYLTKVFGSDLI